MIHVGGCYTQILFPTDKWLRGPRRIYHSLTSFLLISGEGVCPSGLHDSEREAIAKCRRHEEHVPAIFKDYDSHFTSFIKPLIFGNTYIIDGVRPIET